MKGRQREAQAPTSVSAQRREVIRGEGQGWEEGDDTGGSIAVSISGSDASVRTGEGRGRGKERRGEKEREDDNARVRWGGWSKIGSSRVRCARGGAHEGRAGGKRGGQEAQPDAGGKERKEEQGTEGRCGGKRVRRGRVTWTTGKGTKTGNEAGEGKIAGSVSENASDEGGAGGRGEEREGGEGAAEEERKKQQRMGGRRGGTVKGTERRRRKEGAGAVVGNKVTVDVSGFPNVSPGASITEGEGRRHGEAGAGAREEYGGRKDMGEHRGQRKTREMEEGRSRRREEDEEERTGMSGQECRGMRGRGGEGKDGYEYGGREEREELDGKEEGKGDVDVDAEGRGGGKDEGRSVMALDDAEGGKYRERAKGVEGTGKGKDANAPHKHDTPGVAQHTLSGCASHASAPSSARSCTVDPELAVHEGAEGEEAGGPARKGYLPARFEFYAAPEKGAGGKRWVSASVSTSVRGIDHGLRRASRITKHSQITIVARFAAEPTNLGGGSYYSSSDDVIVEPQLPIFLRGAPAKNCAPIYPKGGI
ncbi:hypothetical protein DFH09DRAFT_1279581 [Mycena vulgaris]|nr:hypothetical protein DFH09DRAFT_1279581 [Mycena vulgaris]